jgi:ribosome-associated protein
MAKAARPKKPAAPRLPKDLKLAIAAAADKKAEDVTVLDLRKASAFTDFFLICTGTNLRQVQAIADAVEEAVGIKPSLVEGYARGQWVLIDYFDFIVHVFMPQTREFYALERLWGDAKKIEVA